jgi:hypothetical protein
MEHRQDFVASENGLTDEAIQRASAKGHGDPLFKLLPTAEQLVDDAFLIFHRRVLHDDQRHHASVSDCQPVHLKGAVKYSDLPVGLLDYRIIFSDNLGGELRLSGGGPIPLRGGAGGTSRVTIAPNGCT